MARKAGGSGTSKKKPGKSKKPRDKRDYIKSWSDEKVLEVWQGQSKGEYELADEDLEILKVELNRRKLDPVLQKEEDEDDYDEYAEAEGEEQIPIGYIRLYPETPERNEFYKKRYENARKAWPGTRIKIKGKTWFIVAKGEAEFGYDVHLYFPKDGSVHGTCTCADFTQRGVRRNFPCKHIFMVLVHEEFSPKWPESK
jgi:hypothetical protein